MTFVGFEVEHFELFQTVFPFRQHSVIGEEADPSSFTVGLWATNSFQFFSGIIQRRDDAKVLRARFECRKDRCDDLRRTRVQVVAEE